MDIAKVWRDFKRNGDERLRNILIERYLPLVKYIAERLLAKLPQNIELDDLTSAGIFGLMDAVNGYDLERGVKFETYCTTRIRGAILDELRSLDWVPRIVRNKANRIENTWKALEMQLGRAPTDMEMAQHLEINLEEYQDLIREASAITIVSLTDKTKEDQGSKSLRKIDVLEDKKGVDPEHELKRKEITEFAWDFESGTEMEVQRFRRVLEKGEKHKITYSPENQAQGVRPLQAQELHHNLKRSTG